jgi:hypothetical protein
MNFTEWLMQESGFAHVRRMLFGDVPTIRAVGILTAQNPAREVDLDWQGKEPTSPRDYNKRANKKLVDQLRAGNYGPVRVKGQFGLEEDSFLVPNISREEVLGLGRKYGQESVIWGEKRTDKNKNPYFRFEYIECATGETTSVRSMHMGSEDVQDREDYFTKVKGRKFIIPFFGDPHARKVPGEKYGTAAEIPRSPATSWDADELAKKVEFIIPFFDDIAGADVELQFEGEISYYSDKLSDCPYVKELIEEIRRREQNLQTEGKTAKWYWQNRGVIRECMDKLVYL